MDTLFQNDYEVLNPQPFDQADLAQFLNTKIIGQSEAKRSLVECWQKAKAQVNEPTRPLASLLFLGPTGTGKTRIIEAFTEFMFGADQQPLKVNCAEFQHGHEIAKLIGSPPGYLGHNETKPYFTPENVGQRQCDKLHRSANVILFDEIEKANDALFAMLLGILDRGELVAGNNQRVNFSGCFIVLTSNLGAREIQAAKDHREMKSVAEEAARQRFSPEFYNRLDEVVTFEPLSAEHIEKILGIEIKLAETRFRNAGRQLTFELDDEARNFTVRNGYDVRYGARNIKRALDRHLVRPMVSILASYSGDLRSGIIYISAESESLIFRRKKVATETPLQAKTATASEAETPTAEKKVWVEWSARDRLRPALSGAKISARISHVNLTPTWLYVGSNRVLFSKVSRYVTETTRFGGRINYALKDGVREALQ